MKINLHPHSPYCIFGFSGTVTILSLIAFGYYLGPGAFTVALILIAVEFSFSFDNAIINAEILTGFLGLGLISASIVASRQAMTKTPSTVK